MIFVADMVMSILSEKRVIMTADKKKKYKPKKKATVADNIKMLLNLPAINHDDIDELESYGFDAEKIDNSVIVAYKFLKNAQEGNLSALKEIIKITEKDSDKPQETIKIVDDIKPDS